MGRAVWGKQHALSLVPKLPFGERSFSKLRFESMATSVRFALNLEPATADWYSNTVVGHPFIGISPTIDPLECNRIGDERDSPQNHESRIDIRTRDGNWDQQSLAGRAILLDRDG